MKRKSDAACSRSLFVSKRSPRPTRMLGRATIGCLAFRSSSVPSRASNITKGYTARRTHPYVGYGHRLLPGERLSCAMTKRQADSQLRADLKKRLVTFRRFGRDSLLLAVLSYNVGEYRLLGYGKQPKSRLVQKLESGDRDIRGEYISFCRYRGKELKALHLRRRVELALLYEK